MCLTIHKEKTQKLKDSGLEYVIRYKFVIKSDDKYISYFYPLTWQKGFTAVPYTV